MDINSTLRATILTLGVALSTSTGQSLPSQGPTIDRVSRWSDPEAVSFVNAVLSTRLPNSREADALYTLTITRSTLVLPLFERKIQELLISHSPRGHDSGNSGGSQEMIAFLKREIEEAGDSQALREASKLIKTDEGRFDDMVECILASAITKRNPFTVAYEGLEIGDPALNRRIVIWAEHALGQDSNPSDADMKHQWAKAFVERNSTLPIEEEWNHDPIASRLRPSLSGLLRQDVLKFAAEMRIKRLRR